MIVRKKDKDEPFDPFKLIRSLSMISKDNAGVVANTVLCRCGDVSIIESLELRSHVISALFENGHRREGAAYINFEKHQWIIRSIPLKLVGEQYVRVEKDCRMLGVNREGLHIQCNKGSQLQYIKIYTRGTGCKVPGCFLGMFDGLFIYREDNDGD